MTKNKKTLFRDAVLFGYHGKRNAGDDAFFQIIVKWLEQYTSLNQIRVMGEEKFLPSIETKTTIRGVSNLKTGPFRSRLRELRNFLIHDLVVFSAGSLFQRRSFFWLYVCTVAAKLWSKVTNHPKKIAAIGVSLGPFRNSWDRYWCERALRRFDAVLLRDDSDQENGVTLRKISHGFDLAVCLQSSKLSTSERVSENKQFRVGFSLVDRNTKMGTPEIDKRKKETLLSFFGQNTESISEVIGFVYCDDDKHGDQEITIDFCQQLRCLGYKVSHFQYHSKTAAYLKELEKVDFMICNRMHSFVFSLLCNRPSVAIAYEQKIVKFAEATGISLQQIIQLHELTTESLSEAMLFSMRPEVIRHNSDAIRQACSKQLKLMERVAEHLFQLP